MDLRRIGEFVFGAAVLACGGVFLALAAGRLSAPVTDLRSEAPAAVVAVAAPRGSVRVAPIAAHRAVTVAPVRIVARVRPRAARRAKRAVLPHAPNAHVVAHSSVARTLPLRVAAALPAKPATVATHRPAPRSARLATRVAAAAKKPIASGAALAVIASRDSRVIVVPYPAVSAKPAARDVARAETEPQPIVQTEVAPPAPATHRPRRRVAAHVRPNVERTPEPPIGYDDRPTLLGAQATSVALPAVAPGSIELQTTHLSH